MRKTFEYAVGDSWLLELKGEKTVYTVKDCRYRPEDGKEIYTVAVGNAGVYEITKNRLHFLIHRYFFKKLKTGKGLKSENGVIEEDREEQITPPQKSIEKKKTFEYAVGDSWRMSIDGIKTIWTVKSCEYREKDNKEIYEVDIGKGEIKILTKNRLHYRLHLYSMGRLATGKRSKYTRELKVCEIKAYYAHLRAKEEARAERAAQSMDASAEYRAAAQEVSALSMRLAKAEYIRADAHKILQLKKQLETAKEKRRAVLAQLGLKQGEEKRRIFCDKCGDTGFLTNGRQCSCVAEHEAEIRAYAAEAKRCKATV